MASIRGQYEDKGVQGYYEAHGREYSNPHFASLKEVLPPVLTKLIAPLVPLRRGLLDFCCGSGEFTLIFQDWEARRGVAESDRCSVTGSDPYTYDGYKRCTGREAERWSFDDVCGGVLEEKEHFYDVICICYAIHLLDKSRYFGFFQSLARCASHLLIISPTKNKGVVDPSYGWIETDYLAAQKIHARFYTSTLC